jgi:serine/threonine protein kinase
MTNCDDIQPINKLIANRYKVKKTIFGGMGVIYQCDDSEQDNLPVALKTFKPQYLSDHKFRAQFLQEASIWVEIGWHPNIVQAYRTEYIYPSHEIYLVLEWLPTVLGDDDPSLRSKIRQGEVRNVEKMLNLLLDVTRGMKYATLKVPGIIHRDIKPENIQIGVDGHARISDFGLVCTPVNMLETLDGSSIQHKNSRLKLGGTPLYMSPEQWRNRRISISSDIYSLGCIGLEMLSGDYVIRGRHLKTIAEEHIRGGAMKRLDEMVLPADLKAFFTNCLQTDPGKRFQSWEAVEKELIQLHESLLHCKLEPENICVDVSQKTQVNHGETILSIGEAYIDIHEIQTAIKCFEKAKTIGQNQDHRELIARAEANLGVAYFKLYQYELAIYHFKKSISHYWECGNIEKAFLNYGNISNAYFQLGNFSKAQDSMKKVIEYSRQISNEKGMEFWNSNLTNTILNSGDKKTALEFLLYTLEVEEQHGSDKISMKFMEMLDQFICGMGKS